MLLVLHFLMLCVIVRGQGCIPVFEEGVGAWVSLHRRRTFSLLPCREAIIRMADVSGKFQHKKKKVDFTYSGNCVFKTWR